MIPVHHHRCQRCGTPTECGGSWEQNLDGVPEVTCREFHQAGGFVNPDFLCSTCDALPECQQYAGGEHCDGAKGTEIRDTTGGYLPAQRFCKGCAVAYDEWLANYDGPSA